MEILNLKDKIHALIDETDEDTLQSVYQLLKDTEYTDEFKNLLNEEKAGYEKNKTEVITKESMDILIREAIGK